MVRLSLVARACRVFLGARPNLDVFSSLIVESDEKGCAAVRPLAMDHRFGHFSLQGELSWLWARGVAATSSDTDITRRIERAAGSFAGAIASWGRLEHRLNLGAGACIMQLCPGFVNEAGFYLLPRGVGAAASHDLGND